MDKKYRIKGQISQIVQDNNVYTICSCGNGEQQNFFTYVKEKAERNERGRWIREKVHYLNCGDCLTSRVLKEHIEEYNTMIETLRTAKNNS